MSNEVTIIEELIGKTFDIVQINENNDEMIFVNPNNRYKFHHIQDCCEYVRITQVDGDINDLFGLPILMAEEVVSYNEGSTDDGYMDDSNTWTFYKFATDKGYVTVRWQGSSNGYYSESVDFGEF